MGGIFLCSTTNQHLFLIYQGDDGRGSRIEGDATNHFPPFGPLKVLRVVGIEPAETQEVLANASKVELPLGERSAEDVWAILMQMAEQIENQEFLYALGFFGEPLNSNTAMGNLLWLVGIDVANFFPSDISGSYIGWDRVLEFDYAIEGSSGNDDLFGRGGSQTFHGNEGNDTLVGGLDADTLSGGPGADVFRFDGSALFDARMGIIDQVVDYDQGNAGTYSASEGDQIDLWRLLSTSYDGGNGQPIGSLVRAVEDSSGTFARLQIDVDGTVGGENWVTIAHLGGIHLGDNLSVILDQFYPRVVITAQNSAPSVNIVNGTNGPDTLTGTAGIDQLIGLGGNDILLGAAGADILDGGSGIDRASYSTALAGLTASLANPIINTGDASGDTYIGIEGLEGTRFNDTLVGNSGNNFLIGGQGMDALDGGSGFDTADYRTSTQGVTIDLGTPGKNTGDAAGDTYVSIERLRGGNFADSLYGNSGDNTLDGAGAGDHLDGRGGFDYARYSSAGAGVIASLANPTQNSGDAAGDTYTSIEGLWGSDFADVLIGNDVGINALDGAAGADVLDGRGGFDYARYQSATTGITASLSNPASNTGDAAGDRYISIEGLIGSDFADRLTGDGASNWLVGDGGPDILDGQGGFDYAAYWTSFAAITVSLVNPAINTGDAAGDSYISIEGLVGSNFADTLIGNGDSNELYGGPGADFLNGLGGADYAGYDTAIARVTASLANPAENTGDAAGDVYVSIENLNGSNFNDRLVGDDGPNRLEGRNGNDTLIGGKGSDTLNGEAGQDILIGGAGDDTYIFFHGADNVFGGDTIIENPGEGIDSVYTATSSYTNEANVENAFFIGTGNFAGVGNVLANVLSGGAGVDTLAGRDGDDTLIGGSGADILDGGNGSDRASYSTASAGVTANLSKPSLNMGDAAGDSYVAIEGLEGSNFSDTLIGDNSINTLIGGMGNDTLTGQNGADTFAFSTAIFGKDVITDFAATGNNHDILQFDHSIFASSADALKHAAQVGKDVVISYDAVDTVTLIGVHLHQLATSDFQIV